MALVADATVLIDVLRRAGAAAGWLREPDLPLCSEFTRTEIIRGLRGAERGARLAHGQVATHNLEHFPMFRGLKASY